jgi:hypothetical protein
LINPFGASRNDSMYSGMLFRQALTNITIQQVSLPVSPQLGPTERLQVFFSSMGIPRYFIGSTTVGQVKISQYCWPLSFAAPRQKISLLWKLILSPEICSNRQRMNLSFLAFCEIII